MSRRRRRKSSPVRSLFLWTLCLTLVGWGLWQAELLRRSLHTPLPSAFAATSQPESAIEGTLLTPNHAEGASDPQDPRLMPRPQVEFANSKIEPPLAYPTFDTALTANDLITQATRFLATGDNLAARFALNEALARTADDTQAGELRQSLANLNMPILLGTDILPDDPAARMINIQSGDSLSSLAHAYGITTPFLQQLNPGLDAANLKPDTGIKVVQGPFNARIVKHAGRLDLYARDLYVASCRIDFPEGNLLPRGDYQITAGSKLQFDRVRTWIGFQGITPDTESVAFGWIFGTAGPRGADPKNRATGIHLSDADLNQLFLTLTESHSRLHVDP